MPSRTSLQSSDFSRLRGFSLLELMVSLTILLIVSGVVMSGLMQMSYTQGTITNRSELHASVRSATELMQQEIGQAGRIAATAGTTYTLASAVTAVGAPTSVALSSSSGSFPSLWAPPACASPCITPPPGEQLTVGAGTDRETVSITAYDSSTHTITAVFNNVTGQVAGAPVQLGGTFTSGVVPDTMTNGSTGSLLKIYGDINGDGNMVYVEYKCDTTAGKLYRNSMAYNAVSKPALTDSQILLPNILANPDGSACFTYQRKRVGASTTGSDDYIVNVAVTLTVQTEMKDPKTRQYQTETKALLNVSPRNIFEGWQLASAGIPARLQPMPPSVTALLAN